MTTLTIKEIRSNGIGDGFTVVNPHDGFRKDNTIWFGKCEECGDHVSNSFMTDYKWKHSNKMNH